MSGYLAGSPGTSSPFFCVVQRNERADNERTGHDRFGRGSPRGDAAPLDVNAWTAKLWKAKAESRAWKAANRGPEFAVPVREWAEIQEVLSGIVTWPVAGLQLDLLLLLGRVTALRKLPGRSFVLHRKGCGTHEFRTGRTVSGVHVRQL